MNKKNRIGSESFLAIAFALLLPLFALVIAPLIAWSTHRAGVAPPAAHASLLAPRLAAVWRQAIDKPLKIVGDGKNRWAMVELHDLADCFVRGIEQRATGIFHAVDDTRSTLNECARAVTPYGKIEHAPGEGPFAAALLANQNVSSDATRQKLGWTPRRMFVSSVDEQWQEWKAVTRLLA